MHNNIHKNTVIVIEDEPSLLDAIKRKLSASGYNVEGFESAKSALEYLHLKDHEKPSVIWLDYYLEDMNGIEFMQELKKENDLSEIPVLVISNSANDQKVRDMKDLGVKEYLIKANHRLEDLVSFVQKYTVDTKETFNT